MKIPCETFITLIRQAARKETSSDPENWTPENPLWGHCAVVALIAQDNFGGKIMRCSLEHLPQYAHLRSHYWNKFPNGTEIDFTHEQFMRRISLRGTEHSRKEILSHTGTGERYITLSEKFGKLLEKTCLPC